MRITIIQNQYQGIIIMKGVKEYDNIITYNGIHRFTNLFRISIDSRRYIYSTDVSRHFCIVVDIPQEKKEEGLVPSFSRLFRPV